jgi:hypothetical protein
VHPLMLAPLEGAARRAAYGQLRQEIASGAMPLRWYITRPAKGLYAKAVHKLTEFWSL